MRRETLNKQGNDKNKNKMDKEMSIEKDVCKCPECEKRALEHEESEGFGLAVLVALMPIMTLTLFGQMGIL